MSNPRISLNKLAEFAITASPARRSRIVYDQRFPNPAIVPHYHAFYSPVEKFFTGGGDDPDILHRAVERLRKIEGTKWTTDDAENTATAIERLLTVAPAIIDPRRTFVSPPRKATMTIAGVKVSVQPDLLIHSEAKGAPIIGAVKFYIVKDDKRNLGADGNEYAATLLHQWLVANGPVHGSPDRKLCLFVDCFRGTVTAATTSYQMRMKNIAAACAQIAAIWPTLQQDEETAA